MIDSFVIKCNHGVHRNKFVYKTLANDGSAVWATDINNAKKFELLEDLELFAFEKDISDYGIITIVIDPEKREPA